ncbi:hypothetical protein Aperf_G00000051625 [Anoplocephala perfoliata]
MSSISPDAGVSSLPNSRPIKRHRQSSSSCSQSPLPQQSREKAAESPVRRRRRQSSSSRSTSPILSKISNVTVDQSEESGSFGRRSRKRQRKSSSHSASPSSSPRVAPPKNGSSVGDKSVPQLQNIDLFSKTGGAYIPPARLRQMQAKITDKNTDAYQRIAWEALKKSIHGLINKVNVSNISQVVRQLFMENIIRGRGLLVKSLITSQMASPTFTHIFTALIAIVNSKFPQIGELLLKRLINEFRKAFRRNQKDRCLTIGRFLAHLVNQKVAHELIVLELLTLLLEQTTNDSVEVSVALLKECGAFLSRVVPKGLAGIFDHLRRILNESQCDKRISYMIEVLFQIRRDKWRDYPTVLPELDLIEEDDQITHTLSLLDDADTEDGLNIYQFDPAYEANEAKYTEIRESFLGDDKSSESGSSGSDEEEESDEEADVQGPGEQEGGMIIDQTETNLVHLRRTIYLMLQSSISADEGAHRLLQLKIKPGEEYEVASMVLDCCAQTRSYETRYGSLAQRLCRVMLFSGDKPKPGETRKSPEPSEPPRTYVAQFEKIFGEQYATIHRLETAKLKNVAMFFAHLLFTDSISWGVLECVKLNERDTSSSGRIFLKYLFQELCSFMGLAKLQARLRDETLQPFFAHLLPRDNPKDTRFAINFLTTIGLGGLTIDLREHLQATKAAGEKEKLTEGDVASSSSSDSGSSSSSSDSSDSDSSSESSSSNSSSSSSSESAGISEEDSPRKKANKRRKKGRSDERKTDDFSSKTHDDKTRHENCDGHNRPADKHKSRGGPKESSKNRGGLRGREGISSPSKRRSDSPGSPRILIDQGNTGGDRNIRNASPPRVVGKSLNIPSSDDKGGPGRHGREPSPVVEKRRRYHSPSPASSYRRQSLQSTRKEATPLAVSRSSKYRDYKQSGCNVSPSLIRRGINLSSEPRNEKSMGTDGSPSTCRHRKGTPTPPHRSRLDVANSPGRRKGTPTPPQRGPYDPSISRSERGRVLSGDRSLNEVSSSRRRKATPTPPRRSRYASPPLPPENNSSSSPRRRKEIASPSGIRRDSYHGVQEGSKRDLRREVSRERAANNHRKVTPTPPHIGRDASVPPPGEEDSLSSTKRRPDTPSPRRSRYHSPPTVVQKGSKRDRRLDVSKERVVNSRPKDSSSPPRRSRIASPSPPISPRRGRYDSPPAVQEGSKRNRRREVSRERITGGYRKNTPIAPHRGRYASPTPSKMDREPGQRRDISKERASERRRDDSRGINKYGKQRRRSSSSGERRMRNASPPTRSSARDRSPFNDRGSSRRSPTTSH